MQSYDGIYENGVVRPLTPLTLPESTPVSIVVPATSEADLPAGDDIGSNSDELYEILSRSYNTGETDLAARVDELDP
jgi:predicted DNA-binding antitoxin AbrB/MazE fold protein